MDFNSVFNLGLYTDFDYGFKKFVDLLSLLALFYFSLKALHLSVFDFGFFTRFLNWISLRNCINGSSDSKPSSCMCGLMNFLNVSNPPMIEKWKAVKETINGKTDLLDEDHDDDNKQERCDEDEVFDLTTLRRLVKMERQQANDASLELEKERMSSTTASEEALAMILRLQNQLSVREMEAQQHRRLTHEKQLHDQEVIQSLRWIVMKHESERSILEDRLRSCKQRLMLHMNDGDDANVRINRTLRCLDALDEVLVSSLDLDLSQ